MKFGIAILGVIVLAFILAQGVNIRSTRRVLTKDDINLYQPVVTQKAFPTLAEIIAEEEALIKAKGDVLPAELAVTGLFENLPPKLTKQEVERSKDNFRIIICPTRAFHIHNTPRNVRLVKIALDLRGEIAYNKDTDSIKALTDMIPLGLYEYID